MTAGSLPEIGAHVTVVNRESGAVLGEGELIGWQSQLGNEAIVRFLAGEQGGGNKLASMRPSLSIVATYPKDWLS